MNQAFLYTINGNSLQGISGSNQLLGGTVRTGIDNTTASPDPGLLEAINQYVKHGVKGIEAGHASGGLGNPGVLGSTGVVAGAIAKVDDVTSVGNNLLAGKFLESSMEAAGAFAGPVGGTAGGWVGHAAASYIPEFVLKKIPGIGYVTTALGVFFGDKITGDLAKDFTYGEWIQATAPKIPDDAGLQPSQVVNGKNYYVVSASDANGAPRTFVYTDSPNVTGSDPLLLPSQQRYLPVVDQSISKQVVNGVLTDMGYDPNITLPQWNVMQGASPSGYPLDTTRYVETGNATVSGVGPNAEHRQPVIQITTYKDPITGAAMEARVAGVQVDGQFQPTPNSSFVSGMDADGRAVFTGEVARNMLSGVDSRLAKHFGQDGRVSIQNHGGEQSFEFSDDLGTRAFLSTPGEGGLRQLIVSNPDGVPGMKVVGTAVMMLDDKLQPVGEVTFLDTSGADITPEVNKFLDQILGGDGGSDGSEQHEIFPTDLTDEQISQLEETLGLTPAPAPAPGVQYADNGYTDTMLDTQGGGTTPSLTTIRANDNTVFTLNEDGDIVNEITTLGNGYTETKDIAGNVSYTDAAGTVYTADQYQDQLSQGNDASTSTANAGEATQYLAAAQALLSLGHFNDLTTTQQLGVVANLYNAGASLGTLPTIPGGVTGLLSFAAALESGDAGAIAVAGANLGAQGLNLYASLLSDSADVAIQAGEWALGEAALAEAAAMNAGAAALAEAVPFLNLAIALSNVEENPAALLAATLAFVPGVGPALSLFVTLGSALIGDDGPNIAVGHVQAGWDDNGQLTYSTLRDEEEGGREALRTTSQMIEGLEASLVKDGRFGLIPDALPGVVITREPGGDDKHPYALVWTDDQGREQSRYYDPQGNKVHHPETGGLQGPLWTGAQDSYAPEGTQFAQDFVKLAAHYAIKSTAKVKTPFRPLDESANDNCWRKRQGGAL